jgi:hypothetical protein
VSLFGVISSHASYFRQNSLFLLLLLHALGFRPLRLQFISVSIKQNVIFGNIFTKHQPKWYPGYDHFHESVPAVVICVCVCVCGSDLKLAGQTDEQQNSCLPYPPTSNILRSLARLQEAISHTRLKKNIPEVSGLAAWSEDCKWYSSLPLGAVVSLFCESVVVFIDFVMT